MSGVSLDGGELDLERTTGAFTVGKLAGNGLSRLARRHLSIPSRTRELSGVSGTYFAGEKSGPRDRNCEAGRNATQNCSENRSSRPRLFRVGDRAVAE